MPPSSPWRCHQAGDYRGQDDGTLGIEVMKLSKTLLVAAMCGAVTPVPTTYGEPRPVVSVSELYSWRGSEIEWHFSILSGETSHVKTPEEVFEPKRVISEMAALERRMADLPRHSELIWVEAVPSTVRDPTTGERIDGSPMPGMERLEVPPASVVDEVRALAKKHHVELRIGRRGERP